MYPHTIRLRGPWEVEPVARTVRRADGRVEMVDAPVPPRSRMTMPGRWDQGSLADFTGRLRFRRRFGYPGRIDAHERVWLTFAGVPGAAEVGLNGQSLGRHDEPAQPFEFEVTNLLSVRNELMIHLDCPEGCTGPWGEVALEVRCTAFLRGIRAWAASTVLHVAGEVVGTADRPLELYVLLDSATVHYSTVEPAPGGQPFEAITERFTEEQCRPRADTPGGGHVLRVDLVNGATLWHTVECFVALDAAAGG
jgi:hypothetical protein